MASTLTMGIIGFYTGMLNNRFSVRQGSLIVIVEVESNPNCEASFFGRFKELGPPRTVIQIRVYDRRSEGEWCAVTGWDDSPNSCCTAVARPVEDSGAGVTYVVSGGIYGLRFRPVDVAEPWDVESPRQWGEPYVAVAELRDLRFAD